MAKRQGRWNAELGIALDSIQIETLQVLRDQIGEPGPVALLDFPWHHNAGDSLIYLGEKAYLRQLGYEVRYLSDQLHYDADALRRAVPDGPILMHGGGNFGDRYFGFQQHREQVARDFPDRRIVQLPQSIEYLDPLAAVPTNEALRRHRDYTLLIREDPSAKLAAELFPDLRTEFCPDLAFGVGQLIGQRIPTQEVVWLLRQDSEAVARDTTAPGVDWSLTGADRAVWKLAELPVRAHRKYPTSRPVVDRMMRPAVYDGVARANVRSAIRTISRGHVLVTDRLHAAVTGALLGMPVLAMDNSYGKVSAVFNAYLGRFPNVVFVDGVREAHREIAKLLP